MSTPASAAGLKEGDRILKIDGHAVATWQEVAARQPLPEYLTELGELLLHLDRTDEAGGGLWATLRHATPGGAVVRLELEGADGTLLQVEIPRDRHEVLRPQIGERLYLRPRYVRVFLDPPEVVPRA